MKKIVLLFVLGLLSFQVFSQCSVNAGPDRTICPNQNVPLNGSAGALVTSYYWTTTGSGIFSPNAQTLTATYIPSPADITAGLVYLRLNSNGGFLCSNNIDEMRIIIQRLPTVSAGPDQVRCSDASPVALAGTSINALSHQWNTSGSGSFSNPSFLNTFYTPSASDYLNGMVVLTLRAQGNCSSIVEDQMTLTFSQEISINAGNDTVYCGDVSKIVLKGSTSGNANIHWTTNGSGSFLNPTNVTPSYYPSAQDLNSGPITFTMIGKNQCDSLTDQVVISFYSGAEVNAGPDQFVCGKDTVSLFGTTQYSDEIQWVTNGTGYFIPDSESLNAKYVPSNLDIASGNIILVLSSHIPQCSAEPDSTIITFLQRPIINVGHDQNSCASLAPITLSATLVDGGSASVQWTTSGTGTFSNPNALTTLYYPSSNDTLTGSVELELSIFNNRCSSSDALTIHFIRCNEPCSQIILEDSLIGKTIYLSGSSLSNTPGSYEWTLGDGTTAAGENISHAYSKTGTYNVCLNFTSANGLCNVRLCKTITINKCYVEVSFTKKIRRDTVDFSAVSIPDLPGTYYWNFGDGTIGRGKNATHVYSESGKYPVTLSFYSSDGSCICETVYTDTVKVRVCPKITTSATINERTVTLTAYSNSTETGTYYWSFGDGTYAIGATVTHTYSSFGEYPVSVEFYSYNGMCQCLCKSEYSQLVILGLPACNPAITFSSTVFGTFGFFNANPILPGTYKWNFGNGNEVTINNIANVSHDFGEPGTYTVTLTFTNPGNTCQSIYSGNINIPGNAEEDLRVYPVPASSILNYDLHKSVTESTLDLEIVDAMGSIVHEDKKIDFHSNNSIDILHLPEGVYYLKIIGKDTVYSKRFIKNH